MSLEELKNGIVGAVQQVEGVLGTPTGAAVGGAVAGGAIVGTAVALAPRSKTSSRKKSSRSKRRITHTKRGWKQDRARRSKQKWEVAYQKRKKKRKSSKKHHAKRHGRVRYTKKGQPYVILRSGKARFIKKR